MKISLSFDAFVGMKLLRSLFRNNVLLKYWRIKVKETVWTCNKENYMLMNNFIILRFI